MDWRRSARLGWQGGVRVLALCLSVAAGLAFTAHVAVSTSGVPLAPLAPVIERQLSERTGTTVLLGNGRLTRAEAGVGGPLTLTLNRIAADAPGGTLALPDLRLELRTADALRGRVVPKHVDVRGAHVTVLRTETGLEVAGDDAAFDLVQLAAKAGANGFEGVTIEDADFSYRSEISGAAFEAEGATLDVWPAAGGYEAQAYLPLGDGFGTARATVGEESAVTMTLSDVPSTLLSALVPEVAMRVDGAALSGSVALEGLSDGGTATFDLSLSEGVLVAGDRSETLHGASWSGRFDLARRRLTIDELEVALGGSGGILSGTVTLDGAPSFALTASPLRLALPIYGETLMLERASASGGLQGAVLALESVSFLTVAGADLSGALRIVFGDGTPGVAGTLRGDGPMPFSAVSALWPDDLSPRTRQWTLDNIEGGLISNLVLTTDIPPGLIGSGQRLDTDMLSLAFGLSDASVTYVDGMPPSIGATAQAALTGTSFTLTAAGGTVGGAELATARFVQPKFGPQNTPVSIEVGLRGPVPALLAIADSPPLGYVSKAKLSPSDFSGTGSFSFQLQRPLGRDVGADETDFLGRGTFDRLAVASLPGGLDLSDAKGSVVVDGAALTVVANGAVLGVPATGTLQRRFATGEGPAGMSLEATALLTQRDADALGLPIRQYAMGEAPTTVRLEGTDRFERASLSVDLTPLSLDVPGVGLEKPAGVTGAFMADLTLPTGGATVTVDTLRLSTPDVLIQGSAAFDEDGTLLNAAMPRVFADGVMDMTASLSRSDAGMHLSLNGRHADATELVRRLLSGGSEPAGGPSEPGVPIRFDAELETVTARGGETLSAFVARGFHDGSTLSELSLTAGLEGDGRVSFEIAPDSAGVGRDVRLATDRSGAFMTALFGVESVTGGTATLDATAITGGPITGRFEANDLVLRDAPVIARLLSIGSLTGLADVLNGEGLAFDRLEGALTLEDGTLNLQDARMTGPSLGLSATGAVDLTGRRFDVFGAVAPAYGVNSILGAIPLLGDLLVSREGEGVVAFSYGVTGPIAEPTVTVNTLSALTPGVFRRIFEPIRPDRRTPEELLEEATQAAALREDRETARDAEQLAAEEAELEGTNEAEATTSSSGPASDERLP